jgi:hypothetical protein
VHFSNVAQLQFSGLLALVLNACASSAFPPRAPGLPPSPQSITRKEPGGDAFNPQSAALRRLRESHFSLRSDRDHSVLIPLLDGFTWKRVKFWVIRPFTGFRYGDEHRAVAGLFVRPAPSPNPTSKDCLKDFEKWAFQYVRGLEAHVTPPRSRKVLWRRESILVRSRELSVAWGMSLRSFAATYAAYVPWPNTCVILGYAFPMNEDPEGALLTRDQFAQQAFIRFIPLKRVIPTTE